MSKKTVSDSRLNTLWSHAVIAKYGRCPISGMVEDLQAHHIIPKGRQRRFALRWDIRNGVPLSVTVHRALHDGDLEVTADLIDYVSHRGDIEYLQDLKNMLKFDLLKDISEDEFRTAKKAELTKIIQEYK